MSDLAEFLLARIADDEERARTAAVVDGAAEMLATLPTALYDGLRIAFPNRVLAESEAKRRIIHECADILDLPADDPSCDGLAVFVLRQLALPYADHPDFRPEWRL